MRLPPAILAIGLGCLAIASCAPAAEDDTPVDVQPPAHLETPSLSAVQVSGEGLEIAAPERISLPFGVSRTKAENAVIAAIGEPVSRQANDECGAGPMQFATFAGGLTLNFQDGKLAGWTIQRDEDDLGFATVRGIGVGSTEADLASAYAVRKIAGSTLGDEFTSQGGVNGFLSDRGGMKQVESLYAGTNCFFR